MRSDPQGAGCKSAFQRIDGYQAPVWPDGLPQQLHLHLTVRDMEAMSARVVEFGATRIQGPVHEEGGAFIVHIDPAGHPFRLCQGLTLRTPSGSTPVAFQEAGSNTTTGMTRSPALTS